MTASIPCTGEAAAIAAWAKGALQRAVVEGPLALDLMLSRRAAAGEGRGVQVAGGVDIILVPELNAGNALFKLMSLGMAACAAGVVMGAKVPILLTSRGQGAPDRIASAALGAILAAEARDRRARPPHDPRRQRRLLLGQGRALRRGPARGRSRAP